MADIELNALGVKSDSIPDNWLITLVDPTSGAVAKNMTVAKFVELFTQKQPGAEENKKGVVDSKIYNAIYTRESAYYNPAGTYLGIKIKTSLKVEQYAAYCFSARTGMSQNTIWNQLIFINLKIWDYKFTGNAPISIGNSVVKSVVFYQDTDNTISIFINFSTSVNLTGGALDLLFRRYSYPNAIVSIESSSTNYVAGSHSNEMIVNLSQVNTTAYSLEKNALTETISLNNSILPPPPANCVPESSISAGYNEQFAEEVTNSPDTSIPVEEKYIWSIEKIGQAVLQLQEENKQLKQILNINNEVQQM